MDNGDLIEANKAMMKKAKEMLANDSAPPAGGPYGPNNDTYKYLSAVIFNCIVIIVNIFLICCELFTDDTGFNNAMTIFGIALGLPFLICLVVSFVKSIKSLIRGKKILKTSTYDTNVRNHYRAIQLSFALNTLSMILVVVFFTLRLK